MVNLVRLAVAAAWILLGLLSMRTESIRAFNAPSGWIVLAVFGNDVDQGFTGPDIAPGTAGRAPLPVSYEARTGARPYLCRAGALTECQVERVRRKAARARSSASSSVCRYRWVVANCACPMPSMTTLRSAPLARSQDACVCRRS